MLVEAKILVREEAAGRRRWSFFGESSTVRSGWGDEQPDQCALMPHDEAYVRFAALVMWLEIEERRVIGEQPPNPVRSAADDQKSAAR